jgi:hypothetical protein
VIPRLATVGVAALALVPGPRWSPAKMVEALFAINYPSPHGAAVQHVACIGIGGRRLSGYASFRCQVTWLTLNAPLRSRQVAVWAHPLSGGRVCASVDGPDKCRIIGTFSGVICIPKPWNPPRHVPMCMYEATLRALSARLTSRIGLAPTAIEFASCRHLGPTSSSSDDPRRLDCDFTAYVKEGDGAIARWHGHTVVRYARRGRGYEIVGVETSRLICRPDIMAHC